MVVGARFWRRLAVALAVFCALLLSDILLGLRTSAEPGIRLYGRGHMNGLTESMAVGTLVPVLGDGHALPEGWLPCQGQLVQREQYPELFSILRQSEASGRAARLPDYRRMILLHLGIEGMHGNLRIRAGSSQAAQRYTPSSLQTDHLIWAIKARD